MNFTSLPYFKAPPKEIVDITAPHSLVQAMYKWIIFILGIHFKDLILSEDIDQRLDKGWDSSAGQRRGTGCSPLDSWVKCQGLGLVLAVQSAFYGASYSVLLLFSISVVGFFVLAVYLNIKQPEKS